MVFSREAGGGGACRLGAVSRKRGLVCLHNDASSAAQGTGSAVPQRDSVPPSQDSLQPAGLFITLKSTRTFDCMCEISRRIITGCKNSKRIEQEVRSSKDILLDRACYVPFLSRSLHSGFSWILAVPVRTAV